MTISTVFLKEDFTGVPADQRRPYVNIVADTANNNFRVTVVFDDHDVMEYVGNKIIEVFDKQFEHPPVMGASDNPIKHSLSFTVTDKEPLDGATITKVTAAMSTLFSEPPMTPYSLLLEAAQKEKGTGTANRFVTKKQTRHAETLELLKTSLDTYNVPVDVLERLATEIEAIHHKHSLKPASMHRPSK